jgi:hypothetical protein
MPINTSGSYNSILLQDRRCKHHRVKQASTSINALSLKSRACIFVKLIESRELYPRASGQKVGDELGTVRACQILLPSVLFFPLFSNCLLVKNPGHLSPDRELTE